MSGWTGTPAVSPGRGAAPVSFGVRSGTVISLPPKRKVIPSGRMTFTVPPANVSPSRTLRGRASAVPSCR